MTDWITHEGTEPPLMAPAALVEYRVGAGLAFLRVNEIKWISGLLYRPVTDDKGHKLISAEGLQPDTKYVATDEDGDVSQFSEKPWRIHASFLGEIWTASDEASDELVPEDYENQFRHPGDYRNSLYRVEGR